MRQNENGGGDDFFWCGDWSPFVHYNMEEVGDRRYGLRLRNMDRVVDIDGGTGERYG